jgi:hypothetical protein
MGLAQSFPWTVCSGLLILADSSVQPTWPQWQTSSVEVPTPSQCALQYFVPSPVVQPQAGLVHFFELGLLAMALPHRGLGRPWRLRCRAA